MRIVVLFNLRDGVEAAKYEAWARQTDIPTVRGLQSINSFNAFRSTGLLGSDETPPYAYVEIIDVGDDDRFGVDISTPKMQKVALEFKQFADDPKFMVVQDITSAS